MEDIAKTGDGTTGKPENGKTIKTRTNEDEALLKYVRWIGGALLLFICVYAFVAAFKNNPSTEEPTDSRLSGIEGDWFIQPIERKLSLNLATLHTTLRIRFIDSIYCNIEVKSASGDMTLSRTYKLKDDQLKFENPTTGRVVSYTVSDINAEGNSFCLGKGKDIQFKTYSYNQVIDLINSENSLKRMNFYIQR